ncbi:hypothetical protein LguiB_007020 [Lonicera macranthoides]
MRREELSSTTEKVGVGLPLVWCCIAASVGLLATWLPIATSLHLIASQSNRSLVIEFPISDLENESMSDIIDSLKLKFRAMCATLKVKLEYNGYPKASNVKEMKF